jgi:hypothetical protein
VPASAADRFAEVGGDGDEPCLVSDPCSIEVAINSANGMTSDEVTLLGGLPPTPYVTETPLSVPANVTVHGTVGARSVIETNVGDIGVELNEDSVLRDVIVEFNGTNSPPIQLTGGGTLERVTGVATPASGSASGGCATFGAGTFVIRDSVCWHGDPTGLNGGGVEARNQGAGDQTLILRNVTAVTSNTRPGVRAIATSSGDVTVNATNVIAQSAAGEDVEVPGGFGGNVNLDHSNYDSEDDPVASPGLITDPGTGTSAANQTTPPAFVNAAAGDFHQLPTSTGTIELGTTSGTLPEELDLDGQERSVGAPDIGADELGHQTGTSIACIPASLTLGAGSSSCTATVTDTVGALLPTGDVAFASSGPGSFGDGGACTLAFVTDSVARCQLTYTPAAVGTGSHQISGLYPGGSAHEGSEGSIAIGVAAPAGSGPTTGSSQAFNIAAAIKKCKKKFPKGPKRKKCIKRAKKRAQG